MVDRSLNHPLGHVGSTATYWLKVPGVDWSCRKCYAVQKQGTVCLELTQYDSRDGQGIRKYLCPSCAAKMFNDALSAIEMVNEKGADAFLFFKRV